MAARTRPDRPLVLLVDDDADGALPFRWLLEDEGYAVAWYADGPAALAAARALRPSIIVLDLVLPGLPGSQLLRALKADEQTGSIPVVILSAVVKRLHPDLRPLAAAVLEKPVDVEQLLETLTAAARVAPAGLSPPDAALVDHSLTPRDRLGDLPAPG